MAHLERYCPVAFQSDRPSLCSHQQWTRDPPTNLTKSFEHWFITDFCTKQISVCIITTFYFSCFRNLIFFFFTQGELKPWYGYDGSLSSVKYMTRLFLPHRISNFHCSVCPSYHKTVDIPENVWKVHRKLTFCLPITKVGSPGCAQTPFPIPYMFHSSQVYGLTHSVQLSITRGFFEALDQMLSVRLSLTPLPPKMYWLTSY